MSPNAPFEGAVVVRAREHFTAEWSVEEIRGLLEREFGRRPSWHTVKGWVDPAFADRRRKTIRRTNRQWALRRDGLRPLRQVSPEWTLERMRALKARGLSLRAIGQVAGEWWGEELSADEVRGRLAGARVYRRRAAA